MILIHRFVWQAFEDVFAVRHGYTAGRAIFALRIGCLHSVGARVARLAVLDHNFTGLVRGVLDFDTIALFKRFVVLEEPERRTRLSLNLQLEPYGRAFLQFSVLEFDFEYWCRGC